MTHPPTTAKAAASVTLLVTLLLAAGCATTQRARGVKPAGFLGDYTSFREGDPEGPLFIYLRPRSFSRRFERVIVDEPVIWRGEDAAFDNVSPEDLWQLQQALRDALIAELKKDFEIVEVPGAGVLRVRLCITEAVSAPVGADVLSIIFPPLLLVSAVGDLTNGTHVFVGSAGIEAEVVDSIQGDRLIGMVDRRLGGKSFDGVLDTWSDVRDAFAVWARLLGGEMKALGEPPLKPRTTASNRSPRTPHRRARG